MKIRPTSFFCLLLLLFHPAPLFSQVVPDPLCGPKSLQALFRKLGVESSLEEVSRLSGYREKEGATLLGLYQAARKKGLYAAGVKMGLSGAGARARFGLGSRGI